MTKFGGYWGGELRRALPAATPLKILQTCHSERSEESLLLISGYLLFQTSIKQGIINFAL